MTVLRVYPAPNESCPLQGLYLGLNLHRIAAANDVLIYSNYIASIDGRISLYDTAADGFSVPASIGNARDWRLYQELAAQSDILITSARYFRQCARGHEQAPLPISQKSIYADLLYWRRHQGLQEQPAVAILSRSLDIPVQVLDNMQSRHVYVFTSETADPKKVAYLQQHRVIVIRAGKTTVSGAMLKIKLIELGFKSAYMIAGPEIHHTLLAAGVLNRMFLTQHHSLSGGERFHTIVNGSVLPPREMVMHSQYLDTSTEHAQSFLQFAIRAESCKCSCAY